ncbi:MAG: ATP-binding protein [Actinomycetota bacterium]
MDSQYPRTKNRSPPLASRRGDQTAEPIVGRDDELATVSRFLDSVAEGPATLFLHGEPGIGKTTIWKEAVAAARRNDFRILACRPVQSETRLSYGGLGDLLEETVDHILPGLPEPQRDALEVALLRAPATQGRPDQRAISLALLGALRMLADSHRVLVAIDDVEWLDASSARVLRFAIHRLNDERLGILVSVRGDDPHEDPLGLTAELPAGRVGRLFVGPLDVTAIDRVLRSRLGSGLQRTTLVRLHRVSGGNPFFALEIARALHQRGLAVDPGHALPVPETLHELIRDRLAGLKAAAREELQIIASLAQPTVSLVEAASKARRRSSGLRAAIEAGILEVEGERLRFSHQLLASAVYQAISPVRRQELHRRLAEVVTNPEERARHLALSVETPDADVASALDVAGRMAMSRGAPDAAAELFDMAVRLTPPDRPQEIRRRTMDAAATHHHAGDTARARELFAQAVELSPPGPSRAEALTQLGMVSSAGPGGWMEATTLLRRALNEGGDDPSSRRVIEQYLAYTGLFTGDVGGALEHARAAKELAETSGDPAAVAEALQFWCYLAFLRGRGILQEELDRATALERETEEHWLWNVRPTYVVAQLLKYTDRFDESRSAFLRLVDTAREKGREHAFPALFWHLTELEVWAGEWEAANRYADGALDQALQTGMPFYEGMARYAKALVDAHLGLVDSARSAAEEGIRLSEQTGTVFTRLLNLGVLGFLELSLDEPVRAQSPLQAAVDLARSMMVEEPGLFRVVPDAIEALIGTGLVEEAAAILEPFEEQARSLGRIWALATAARSRALLLAASGDLPASLDQLTTSIAWHDRLADPFERARTLLVRGIVLRRAKRKREAKASLEQALGGFEGLGAALWSARTRGEMERIGGRAPAPLGLTPTEERVAELVAAGRTNREVAEALFMSVNTVEANLKRIYRKRGVRSRAELAATYARGGATPANS